MPDSVLEAAGPLIVVDDDAVELRFARQAHARSALTAPFVPIQDPRRLLDYLEEVAKGGAEMPCAALIDIRMPELDGFALVEALRARGLPEPPLAFLTTSEFPGDRQRARDLGCDYYTKPIELDELASILKAVAQGA